MKKNDPTSSDPLINQLRDQAQQYNPQPSAGLRRRLLSSLAEAPSPQERPAGHWGWLIAGTICAAVVAVAIVMLRDTSLVQPIVKVPHTQQPVVQTRPTATLFASAADPVTLAQRWVEAPFEKEMTTLRNHLNSATDTVTGVLPAIKLPRAKTAL